MHPATEVRADHFLDRVLARTWAARRRVGLTESQLRALAFRTRHALRVSVGKRTELPALLTALGLNGQGVEVGVQDGDYSEILLNGSQLAVLFSVDPWREFSQQAYRDSANVNQAQQDVSYRATVERLERFGRRSEILRETSDEAVGRFKDDTLDFVYIDAQHHYEACAHDIRTWWPKVRAGGVLAGHDYLEGVFPSGVYGVKRAVDEFIAGERRPLYVTSEQWPTWYVHK